MANKPVSAVRSATRILRAFSIAEPELGVTELARRLGLSKAGVHHLLATLVEERMIERDPVSRRYRLSIKMFELGTRVAISGQLHRAATVPLDHLHFTTSATVQVGILDDAEVVYIERRESQATLRTFEAVGHRNVAHATSTGKVLLAFLPPDEMMARIANRPLVPLTPHTITQLPALLDQLRDVRRRGYAEQLNESSIGVASVAAPIRDDSGRVVAAISMARPAAGLTPMLRRRHAAATMEAARQISERLGFRPSLPLSNQVGERDRDHQRPGSPVKRPDALGSPHNQSMVDWVPLYDGDISSSR
jgi:IclR family transcriptional regulator, KDG regulon repressor